MTNPAVEPVAKISADNMIKNGNAAEKIAKGTAAAFAESGNGSTAAFQELTKAYQALASKNAKNLTVAIQSLSTVKSPTEFLEMQQKLFKDNVEAAVGDGQHIADLTTAVFTAAFEPMKTQFEAVHKSMRI
jgi:phasin family protein